MSNTDVSVASTFLHVVSTPFWCVVKQLLEAVVSIFFLDLLTTPLLELLYISRVLSWILFLINMFTICLLPLFTLSQLSSLAIWAPRRQVRRVNGVGVNDTEVNLAQCKETNRHQRNTTIITQIMFNFKLEGKLPLTLGQRDLRANHVVGLQRRRAKWFSVEATTTWLAERLPGLWPGVGQSSVIVSSGVTSWDHSLNAFRIDPADGLALPVSHHRDSAGYASRTLGSARKMPTRDPTKEVQTSKTA